MEYFCFLQIETTNKTVVKFIVFIGIQVKLLSVSDLGNNVCNKFRGGGRGGFAVMLNLGKQE